MPSSNSYSTYGREVAPVHMSNVECSMADSRLSECPHDVGGSGTPASQTCNYRHGSNIL